MNDRFGTTACLAQADVEETRRRWQAIQDTVNDAIVRMNELAAATLAHWAAPSDETIERVRVAFDRIEPLPAL